MCRCCPPKRCRTLVDRHHTGGAAATVVTAVVDDPHGYGRIVALDESGEQIARIVEEKDASPAERQIREINSGIYAFALDGLFDAVRSIAAENAQNEYYLPDLVAIYRQRGTVRRNRHRLESRRDSGHQQPRRAGGSEPNRARPEERLS